MSACALGIVLVACAGTREGLSGPEVIDLIVRNECAAAQLRGTPMLVALVEPGDTTYIRYPRGLDAAMLDATTPVQLGAVTASFFVPSFLEQLYAAKLTLDSVAIPVRSADGRPMREITFADLLLHRSDLPVVSLAAELSPLDQLLAVDRLLREQDPTELRGRYRYDHWNYTLAREALRTRLQGMLPLRAPALAYNDRLPDSTRAALGTTVARAADAPRERQHPELFAASTAGVASTYELIALLDSLSRADLANLPEAPTLPDRPNMTVVPGWHKLALADGRAAWLSTGRTRRHAAAVAYFPATQTGVTVVALDSKPLDCLALDILRNLNRDWKRQPASDAPDTKR